MGKVEVTPMVGEVLRVTHVWHLMGEVGRICHDDRIGKTYFPRPVPDRTNYLSVRRSSLILLIHCYLNFLT